MELPVGQYTARMICPASMNNDTESGGLVIERCAGGGQP